MATKKRTKGLSTTGQILCQFQEKMTGVFGGERTPAEPACLFAELNDCRVPWPVLTNNLKLQFLVMSEEGSEQGDGWRTVRLESGT